MSNDSTERKAATQAAGRVPIIDIGPLVAKARSRQTVAEQIGQACRDVGFFYVVGHGVDEPLVDKLDQLSRQFFAQHEATKMQIRMAQGGRAWRGYFPIGDELTSGKADQKEGIYFGAELGDDPTLVRAGPPLHGRNLFPGLPGFRETVLAYLDALTKLGHTLMAGIALSLGVDESYFADRYTGDPLILFRIFNYPYTEGQEKDAHWGVGEHTDYGLLTILWQDNCGGLEVKSKTGWIAAPPIPNSFVCNLGDMLDRMTRGLYRSTPHRVCNLARKDRLSFPFFFDPNFNAEVKSIDALAIREFRDDRAERWDRASVHEFSGTYGEYLLKKVGKVFPELRRAVM